MMTKSKNKLPGILFIGALICFYFAVPVNPACAKKDLKIPKINSTVEFSGSWFEIGRQQAYYFPEQTLMVAGLLRFLLGVSGSDIRAYYADIQTLIPQDLDQQMQGIADGLSEYWHIPPDIAWNQLGDVH